MYKVALDTFHGPLDLLLHLVKRNEVDVLDIPIGKLTEQFLDYLRIAQTLDVELAGDFIVMAATLMEIKSRLLLPAAGGDDAAADDETADPRRELVRQLLEYRKFKDAAAALEAQAEKQTTRVSRVPEPEPPAPGQVPVRPVELWDLVSAFARLVRETQSLAPTTIQVDDTPQHVYEELVRRRVREEGRVPLTALFLPPHTKPRLIGLFLAVLELIKSREVWLDQPEAFGEIWVLRPEMAEMAIEPEQ